MPKGPGKIRNNRGARKSQRHDDRYWDRLRREFQTCTYQHGGAYALTPRPAGYFVESIRDRLEHRHVQLQLFMGEVERAEKNYRMENRLAPLKSYRDAAIALVKSRRS